MRVRPTAGGAYVCACACPCPCPCPGGSCSCNGGVEPYFGGGAGAAALASHSPRVEETCQGHYIQSQERSRRRAKGIQSQERSHVRSFGGGQQLTVVTISYNL